MTALSVILSVDDVKLIPFEDNHIEPLREICALDEEIWEIYPINLYGDSFDTTFALLKSFHLNGSFVPFAAYCGDEMVGITNYINPDGFNGVVEIGGTFFQPSVRGTGFNDVVKKLMIDHAFACGFAKIEWRVDDRNHRSKSAVLKLGAKHEGTLRRNRKTWTGFVRDTCVFGLLKEEWKA
jgi:RimJ/RimL family protein N-acetyltransferase